MNVLCVKTHLKIADVESTRNKRTVELLLFSVVIVFVVQNFDPACYESNWIYVIQSQVYPNADFITIFSLPFQHDENKQ